MTAIFILVTVLVLTYFAFNKRNLPLSFVAAISWILLLVYTRSNPIAGLASGSYGDEIILFICILMSFILLYNGWVKYKEEKVNKKQISYYNDSGDYVGRYEKPETETTPYGLETSEEHRQRLHQRIVDARERRRQYRG